jgi:hypothetical protein
MDVIYFQSCNYKSQRYFDIDIICTKQLPPNTKENYKNAGVKFYYLYK